MLVDNKLKKVKLQSLRSHYELLQMNESESVAKFFNRVQALTNQMKSYGETLTDLLIVDKV